MVSLSDTHTHTHTHERTHKRTCMDATHLLMMVVSGDPLSASGSIGGESAATPFAGMW
jgi:hypothetical protein